MARQWPIEYNGALYYVLFRGNGLVSGNSVISGPNVPNYFRICGEGAG